MLDTVGPERMKNRSRYIHGITHPFLKKKPQIHPRAQHMDELRSTPPTRQGWGDLTPDFSCSKLLDKASLLNQPLTLEEKESLDGTPVRQQALVANGFWDD